MARTSLITAAAIAGVALAGTAAIVANVGILNAAESTEIGTLSAAGDLLPSDPQVVDVYLDDPASTTTVAGAASTAPETGSASPASPASAGGAAGASRGAPAAPASATGASAPVGSASAVPGSASASAPAATSGPNARSQTFAVADAGTVTVTRSSTGLRLGDVVANAGWSSRSVRVEASIIVTAFSNGARTLELTVTPGPDGSIVGSIADTTTPTPTTTTVRPTTTTAPSDDDDDDEHEYEEPEHEGGEDDD